FPAMPATAITILTDATNGIRNNVRRMRSGTIRERPRAKGKENRYPGSSESQPSPDLPSMPQNPRRAFGTITSRTVNIPVHVPSMDDIWRLKVPQGVSLLEFREKVELKLGFPVVFVKNLPHNSRRTARIATEDAFKRWVAGRVKDGRNRPIVA
ncbi:hypothetical protein K474DRAFT_1557979, partial [Panus rudis PR-1116 ss-1]